MDEEIEVLKKKQQQAEMNAKEEKNLINQKKKVMEEKKREYNERMLLRFGNIIPLETLEVSGPSQVVLDLQQKFQKMEQRCNRKKEEAEADLAATQRALTEAIKSNTGLLDLIRTLGNE